MQLQTQLLLHRSKDFPPRRSRQIWVPLSAVIENEIEVFLFIVSVCRVEERLICFLSQIDFFPSKVAFIRSLVLVSNLFLA